MKTNLVEQKPLFQEANGPRLKESTSGSFVDNMRLPIHRWFRYSAGFSGAWAEDLISREAENRDVCVFDPFAGSGTTLIAAEQCGVESWGIDPHPFVVRVARAKLAYRSSPREYLQQAKNGCFRHQVLLRGCGQWYRCGRDRVARPSEQENLDPRPQRNRRRQEDVSKGEPSNGQTGLHSRSSDLTSELQSSVRVGRSCNSNGATPGAHRASPSSERGKAFVSKGMPSFVGWSDLTAR